MTKKESFMVTKQANIGFKEKSTGDGKSRNMTL